MLLTAVCFVSKFNDKCHGTLMTSVTGFAMHGALVWLQLISSD
jgi:hypothetical protein